MIARNLALVLAALVLAACTSAVTPTAVVIDSVSDNTIAHDQTITVTGSGFGTKTNVAPVVWDDVEGGSFSPDWQSSGSLRVGDESRHSHSSHSGTNNFQAVGGDGGYGYFTGPNTVLGESWFVQYWFKLNDNFDWGTSGWSETPGPDYDASLANVKLFRMWNPADDAREDFALATMGYGGGGVQYITENVSNSGGLQYFGSTSDWAKGTWHLFQFEYRESAMGANDGVFRWWVDGVLEVDDRDIMTREEEAEPKRPFIVGFYNSWEDGGTDRDDFYIDDAYIDNTWARVEIGDNHSYNDCTHREIQIPTAWADDNITVDINTGSFAGGDRAYLFVVNAEGVASSGYPVTIP